MKFKYNKVAIVGMGLMGASLGAALLKGRVCREVVGIGRNLKRLNLAKRLGAATSVTLDVASGAAGAQVVVISLPVMMIPSAFNRIQEHVDKKCLVTDMGSVKGFVCSKIAGIDGKRVFAGSHPMVGSEKTGAANLNADMFRGGACIVTPSGSGKKGAEAARFWKALGMRTMVMTPLKHDAVTARISHFPHLMAFVQTVLSEKEILNDSGAIGRGFKDMTRIAASDPEIWNEIILANKKEVLKCLDDCMNALESLRGVIEFNRAKELKAMIEKSADLRKRLK